MSAYWSHPYFKIPNFETNQLIINVSSFIIIFSCFKIIKPETYDIWSMCLSLSVLSWCRSALSLEISIDCSSSFQGGCNNRKFARDTVHSDSDGDGDAKRTWKFRKLLKIDTATSRNFFTFHEELKLLKFHKVQLHRNWGSIEI